MDEGSNDRGVVRMDDGSTDRGVVKDRSPDRSVVRMDQLIEVS